MRRLPSTVRVAALIAAGSLAIHELRYLIGYGDHAGDALADQGHAYLSVEVGLAAVLLALAGAQLLIRLSRARRTGVGEHAGLGFRLSWLAATGALLTIYVSQELLEGLLASGHPEGLGAVVGHGGWLAFPLAPAGGFMVALALRGAHAAVAIAARRARQRAPSSHASLLGRRLPWADLPVSSVLARHLAGRAPPLAF